LLIHEFFPYGLLDSEKRFENFPSWVFVVVALEKFLLRFVSGKWFPNESSSAKGMRPTQLEEASSKTEFLTLEAADISKGLPWGIPDGLALPLFMLLRGAWRLAKSRPPLQ